MSTNGTLSKSSIKFLKELRKNNNREWFAENKQRYEDEVRTPALLFIEKMEPYIRAITNNLSVMPRKSGGSLMRVYRDTRFANDKTPYKTNIGIQFRHSAGKDVHAPGLYVHVDPDEAFIGVGMWRPDSPALKGIRSRIESHPDAWKKSIGAKSFKKRFELGGESLKTAPRGYAKDHPMIIDLRRKDFIAIAKIDLEEVFSSNFEKFVGKHLADAQAYMRFLCDAIEQPF